MGAREENKPQYRTEQAPLTENANYLLKFISFLQARHFVIIDQSPGPVHAHTWQLQIDAAVPTGRTAVVAFSKIAEKINAGLAPFENTVLNQKYPFNQIQPSNENIAMFLFSRLEEMFLEDGLGLAKLTIWENPIRGVEVSPNTGLDILAEDGQEAVGTYLNIKLISFMKAQHYVTFGPTAGPVHAHTWQILIDIKAPVKKTGFMAFNKKSEILNSLLAPYENTALNDIHPFDQIQPSSENIAMYFFNQLKDVLQQSNLKLERLAVWENPTRGIEISGRTAGLEDTGEDDFAYTIKLILFVNAQHFITIGQNVSPVHVHAWQFNIDVQASVNKIQSLTFTSILKDVSPVTAPYENTVLNYIFPFNQIQPSIENISMYFFNRLEDAFSKNGLKLAKLSIWENPTRGIEVTIRNAELDNLVDIGMQDLQTIPSYREAAAMAEEGLSVEPGTDDADKEVEPGEQKPLEAISSPALRKYRCYQYIMALLLISLAAFWAYSGILMPLVEQHYPWGSDSWGHLFKAEFLYDEILRGNYYPQFTEYWYNGSQPFRYWAPLPYYFLAFLRMLTGDIFIAGNWYIFICALFGGLSWLLLAQRMGLWPATMAGVLWVVWLDNVRVAFSEGNLPRVLATALLPLLFVVFVQMLEKRRSLNSVIATVVIIHLVILCHAMIGAVYSLGLGLFTFWLWVFRGCHLKDGLRGLLVLAVGVVTSSWWLLPSLTGGITEIDPQAVKEAIQFVPALVSLDPLHRFTNQEAFYWGISLIAAIAATLFAWRAKPPWAKSLILCGIALVLITFPAFSVFYVTLPLGHVIWPLRFSSFAALAILAACLTFYPREERQRPLRFTYTASFLVISIFAALLADCLFSVRLLAHAGTRPVNLLQSAELLKDSSGWRVATIDLSRLGSAPSFVFSETAGLEQVFGWAWQGAVTSSNIMLLNTGLELQHYPFLFRSCVYLGATELAVKEDAVRQPQTFYRAARIAGYRLQGKFGGISIWRGADRPYLVVKENKCLVIGKYAGTNALLFPEVEMGFSKYIDDYSAEYLKKYSLVIISGAEWWSKKKAEELITEYAASGGRVVIELAGMPKNILAKQPEFLGVYGEPVVLRKRLEIFGHNRSFLLEPFSTQAPTWKAYVPMVLDHVELEFDYYGNQAPVYGYKLVEGHKVWFLGGSLTYHAFLTEDQEALSLIKNIFGLSTDYVASRLIPLTNYQVKDNGYLITCHLDDHAEVIIPIAAMDGIKVKIDGTDWPFSKFENLILLDLPAGTHHLDISLIKTPIYYWGSALSIGSAALLVIVLGCFILRKQAAKRKCD